MGNTNTELAQRITELEKKLAKYETNRTPVIGEYEGQLWYDKVNKTINAFDGKSFINLNEDTKIFMGYTALVVGDTSLVITSGFLPKKIYFVANSIGNQKSWGFADITSGGITNWCNYEQTSGAGQECGISTDKCVFLQTTVASTKLRVTSYGDNTATLTYDNNSLSGYLSYIIFG